MKKITKLHLSFLLSFISICPVFSEISFNGMAGVETDIGANSEAANYDPQLMVQSFFAGQLNLSENFIIHGEITIKTSDLIENSFFEGTPATFFIDELSAVYRFTGLNSTNYLSAFLGTYEPIGSDIFLRRQFGIKSITSKTTESWLGLSGSIIYPLVGAGIADVIHFETVPISAGFYGYFNQELSDSYVINFDTRFACVFPYLTLDLATGIGAPLNTNYYTNAFIVVDTLFWRIGMNLLVGNPYTASLFMQLGSSEIPFSKTSSKFSLSDANTYILIEPRFAFKRFNIHLTAYSLPEETVKDFLFIDDTLGINLNIFSDSLFLANQPMEFGVSAGLSFPSKSFMDLQDIPSLFNKFNILAIPYMKTKLFNGDLNTLIKLNIMDFTTPAWYNGISISLGYRLQF